MEIKNLKDTPLSDIVQALTLSFADYFVQLSSDVAYWEKRFESSRVDYSLSFGMFENGQLVGFIINGIDELNGVKTAYNTGTGVMASSRGHKIIDQLYAHALPYFKEAGIKQCTLEVILQNERAIHVYERIGFHISKEMKCFKGTLKVTDPEITAQQVPFGQLEDRTRSLDGHYSWDNTTAAIEASGDRYQGYEVYNGADVIGYFVLNPATHHLIQFEVTTGNPGDLKFLLSAVAGVSPEVKINNVSSKRTEITEGLLAAGLDNFIDQYEMQMSLN
jgi:ribosomal protein S18 acetylase RimI-like enzyme